MTYFAKSDAKRHIFSPVSAVLAVGLFCLTSIVVAGAPAAVVRPPVIEVDEMWAAIRVNFAAISVGPVVYIAYYDSDRELSVARVDTQSGKIRKRKLGSVFGGWDSHNYITLGYDRSGHLHVAGNMHGVPLVYGRMLEPNNIDSLTRLPGMVGRDEDSVTYPRFFDLPSGDLGFAYRSGRSGDGIELINKFDGESWSRYSGTPIFSPAPGGKSVNAYHTGFVYGPDRFFHTAWVWRRSRMAESNFNVSYARSKDLKHWVDSQGNRLTLPLTPENSDVADKTGPDAGLFNNVRLGFNKFNKPVISYVKYDESGFTQLYHATPGEQGWRVAKMTDWPIRWTIQGSGTLPEEISFSGVTLEDGQVIERVSHFKNGSSVIHYGPDALQTQKVATLPPGPSKACPRAKPWREISMPVRATSPASYQGQVIWRTLPRVNTDKPRPCQAIGLAENCKMTSKLLLAPAAVFSSGTLHLASCEA